MLIDAANLTALRDAINARFQAGFQAAQPFWNRLAMEVPSATEINTYAWMAEFPRFREWVGERTANNLKSRAAQILNKKFEDTVKIPRDKLEDDQYGIYGNYSEMMGTHARKIPDDLLVAVLQSAAATVGWDGQFFFDTDHPVNMDDAASGVQSNNFTTTALTAGNYASVRASMSALKGESGRPLGVAPNLIIVPPQLEVAARTIVAADVIPSSAGTASQTNVLKGTADVLVVPELANEATTWYLADTTRPIKPFVWQNRSPAEFQSFFDPKDEHVFKFDEFLFGGRARGNVGLGLWFLIARAIA